jgi:hypothetical protein
MANSKYIEALDKLIEKYQESLVILQGLRLAALKESGRSIEEEIETVYYPGKVCYLNDPNVIETYYDPDLRRTVVRRWRDTDETL